MQRKLLLNLFFIPFAYLSGHFSYANEIAVGKYESTKDGISYPLLVTSTDNALNWTYPESIYKALPKFFLGQGQLVSSTCSNEHFCLAAGSYSNSVFGTNWPLVAISKDDGTSWKYLDINFPKDYWSGIFAYDLTTTCNNSVCIIASDYRAQKDQHFPFIAVTHDRGESWSYPEQLKDTNFVINKIDCTEESCVAVGLKKIPDSNKTEPLIAVSTDAITWLFPKINSANEIFNISNVKCKNNVCIAIADYFYNQKQINFQVLRSQDKGFSWDAIQVDAQPDEISTFGGTKVITNDGNGTWVIAVSESIYHTYRSSDDLR